MVSTSSSKTNGGSHAYLRFWKHIFFALAQVHLATLSEGRTTPSLKFCRRIKVTVKKLMGSVDKMRWSPSYEHFFPASPDIVKIPMQFQPVRTHDLAVSNIMH